MLDHDAVQDEHDLHQIANSTYFSHVPLVYLEEKPQTKKRGTNFTIHNMIMCRQLIMNLVQGSDLANPD